MKPWKQQRHQVKRHQNADLRNQSAHLNHNHRAVMLHHHLLNVRLLNPSTLKLSQVKNSRKMS